MVPGDRFDPVIIPDVIKNHSEEFIMNGYR
jgi:hypothetical protein